MDLNTARFTHGPHKGRTGAQKGPKYVTKLDKIPQLSPGERKELKEVCDKYAFRSNDYYLSLINWNDPDDPIRKIVIPDTKELEGGGRLDASNEESYTVVPGLQHKYQYTALLLVNDVCGAYCRFCFRKRLFMDLNDETQRDVSEGIAYIRRHKELSNVLLTGGDPLVLSTPKIENIVRQLREIEHVKIIRIGSKIPAFNPFRILNDPSLLDMFRKYSHGEKKIYIMAHFNHPRELTNEAISAMDMLARAGAVIINQTPLIKGVNNDPYTLAALFNKLSYIGVPPYYLFQGRPTAGNETFSIPIEKSFEIFEQARMLCSGLAKRARLVMSHSTGKIEVVGKTETHIYMRYHRAANPQERARFMVFERNPDAYWFDDYREAVTDYSIKKPYNCLDPD
ncbi:Lysine 2,3-aminomutase related protein [hydrothermal vent metagenome]|uniref:Lysine 2,3-aminomutase related protein n=1 Tax=hydrothermal vent metagenome TaxID=652676 RepID=A0A3B1CGJ3_9ZZZZ